MPATGPKIPTNTKSEQRFFNMRSRVRRGLNGYLLNRLMRLREWSTILGGAIVVLLLSKLSVVAYLRKL